jgi:hypothetical protein
MIEPEPKPEKKVTTTREIQRIEELLNDDTECIENADRDFWNRSIAEIELGIEFGIELGPERPEINFGTELTHDHSLNPSRCTTPSNDKEHVSE